MGMIVFDIQCFNWDQAAELRSPVLMAPWFPSVKRGFLSDILRNARFPFRGKPNRETRHCFALASCSIGISDFFLPVMDTGSKVHAHSICHSHILCISSLTSAHMAGLGKHLVIFASASQWRTRPWSLRVYSIFSNYIVAGCSPEVTWTTIWNCGRSFHKIGVVQKFLAVMEINLQKESNTEPVRNTANLRACLVFNQGILFSLLFTWISKICNVIYKNLGSKTIDF